MSKKIKVAVCKGRHEIPQATDGAIFGNTIKEMDPFSLLLEASKRLIWEKNQISGCFGLQQSTL